MNNNSTEHRAEISNPFSTGGGGVNYEVNVQTYFVASMILGWKIMNLKADKVEKIKLQGRYEGYDTDDCIIFGDNGNKMLCQIKHAISINNSDEVFNDVIKAAWNDFNNNNLFNKNNDCINIIVSGLSKVDIESLKTIKAWANSCENEDEFITKINMSNFSSKEKKQKFEIIQNHLKQVKEDLTDKEIWQFLKVFSINILDVDTPNTFIKSSYMSALENLVEEKNFGNKLYCYVADKNQNAGTISLQQIKQDLSINVNINNEIKKDRQKLIEHTNLIIGNMNSDIAGITIKRNEEIDKINSLLENNQLVLITGERGIGKSGIAKEYWKKYCNNKYSLAIRAEEFNYPNIKNTLNGIGINSNLTDLFDVITLCDDKIVFIESLEKILELETNRAFLDFLSLISKHSEWKIVATIRNYAIQQIIMNFISEYGIKYDVIEINEFSKEQIDKFIEKIPNLESLKCNKEILELVKNPFYLSSVYKITNNGYILNKNDNKETIKNIIWENIIKKNSEIADGMPYKREKTFVEIALKRSATMAFSVDINEFDISATTKLQEDDLVFIKDGFVYLTHDVFEDWAIEKYIEKQYKKQSNINEFLSSIGCEQSMCRAYRLWLNEKDDQFVNNYIKELFSTKDVKNIWLDETMSAIIFSNKVGDFLRLLEKELLNDNGSLLKRLCFMIRVTAKKPNMDLFDLKLDDSIVKKSALISLEPYGNSWEIIIKFLYNIKEKLSSDMYIHCIKILKEWLLKVKINEDLPIESREAGLLSLFIAEKIKDNYREKEQIKELFSVVIRTYNSIQNEFNTFIENTILNDEEREKNHYIDDIAEQIYNSLDTCFIAKDNPEILIKIAKNEWLLEEERKETKYIPFYVYDDMDENRVYGLKSFARRDYFLASGAREPFRSLFRFCPKKAIDFVIELCNICAETFIKKSLEKCSDEERKDVINKITYNIKKEDGTIIKQYGIGDFWCAYRGISNTPYLIQSALMALENELITHFEHFKDNKEEIDYCIDYIISKSNSVFTTSVLASVSIPYYKSLGKSSLLLLQNNEFYDMDMSRIVHEMGENEINWFAMNNDVCKKIYENERKKAATREWRRESLESLATKLQFTDLKYDVWRIIDELNEKNKEIAEWNFRLNRIDVRKFKFELDEENNQIICMSGEITDEKLLKISEDTKKKSEQMNRFYEIINWVSKAKKKEFEFSTHKNVSILFREIQELLKIYDKLDNNDKSSFFKVGLIESIAIIYINFNNELKLSEKNWCRVFLIKEYIDYEKTLNDITFNGRVDNTGLWTASETFACICSEIKEKECKELLVKALTSCDMDIRLHTSIGIGKYLWNINKDLAKWCSYLVKYFDILESKEKKNIRSTNFLNKNNDDYLRWLKKIRKELLKIDDFSKLIDAKAQYSLYSITEEMLILPQEYNLEFDDIIFEILDRIILAEKNVYGKMEHRINEGYFDVLGYYSEFFGNYFYQMKLNELDNYMDKLSRACNSAPHFMSETILIYRILAEKNNKYDKYWEFFNKISIIIISISKELAKGENYKFDERAKLLSDYIYLNTPWQPIDFEKPPIEEGITYICEFATNSNDNVIVFEGISSLIYHFPKLMLKEGLSTFKNLKENDIKKNFEKSNNSIFYLENALHSYIINLENNTISRDMYNVCEKILNVLIECASSKAYYTREYLMKSKRVV